MLNKNEIINELNNKEFIVRNAVYEYVCNLNLYDDINFGTGLSLIFDKKLTIG